jgi:hypothetical protein
MSLKEPTPEEIEAIRERNRLQKEDALRYRNWAEKFEGRSLTDNEVMIWYIGMGLALMFAIAWTEGQEPLNLYYTGVEVGHKPTRVDAYCHYRHWLDEVLTRHERESYPS